MRSSRFCLFRREGDPKTRGGCGTRAHCAEHQRSTLAPMLLGRRGCRKITAKLTMHRPWAGRFGFSSTTAGAIRQTRGTHRRPYRRSGDARAGSESSPSPCDAPVPEHTLSTAHTCGACGPNDAGYLEQLLRNQPFGAERHGRSRITPRPFAQHIPRLRFRAGRLRLTSITREVVGSIPTVLRT